MKNLFYLIAILPLIIEMHALSNPLKDYLMKKGIKEIYGNIYEKGTEDQKVYMKLQLMYMVWSFIGLFTFQWVAFLSLFVLGFIPKTNKVIVAIDAFLSMILIIFIILNEYHFRIDLFGFILKNI